MTYEVRMRTDLWLYLIEAFLWNRRRKIKSLDGKEQSIEQDRHTVPFFTEVAGGANNFSRTYIEHENNHCSTIYLWIGSYENANQYIDSVCRLSRHYTQHTMSPTLIS